MMAGLTDALLRHALHYLKELDLANDQYKAGSSKTELALGRFDTVWPNIQTALASLLSLVEPYLVKGQKQIGLEIRTAVELCNVFPDAGAYLFNLRIDALERKKWLQTALQASQFLQNDKTSQAHLGNLGLVALDEGKPDLAIWYFRKALRIARKIGDQVHEAAWLGDIGNALASLGEHRRAIAYHRKHLKLSGAVGDLLGESHALGNLGVSYAFLGKLKKAEQFYGKHLALSKQVGDRRGEAHGLMNLGFIYYDRQLLDQAEIHFKASSKIADEVKDYSIWHRSQAGMADVWIDQGKFETADLLLQELIGLATIRNDRLALLNLFGSLGNLKNVQENYEAACYHYSEQLQLAKHARNKAYECAVLSNLASVYRKMDRYDDALSTTQAGISLAREIGALHYESFLSWEMGLIYEQVGDLKKALKCFDFTVTYERTTGHPDAEKDAIKLNSVREQINYQDH